QEFKIASCPQTANPRYLMTLIEDITLWGSFEQLDQKIDTDLKATSTSELYEIVLSRIDEDFKSSAMKLILSYIWTSNKGLHVENELKPILQKEGYEIHEWQHIFTILEDFLISAGGLLNFSNN